MKTRNFLSVAFFTVAVSVTSFAQKTVMVGGAPMYPSKNIVENATLKANKGKEIANSMIEGYKELNENIKNSSKLIYDIENSSKEQLLGIEQINDAVNSLDEQTQQNAQIASLTHDVAVETDEIAKMVVKKTDEKKFVGKDSIDFKKLL